LRSITLQRLLIVVMVGCVAVGARAAEGDDDDDPTAARLEAKRLRDEGVRLVDRGELARGLADFERAYALYPSPNLLFNIGLVHERLGRIGEAVAAFEQFLAEATTAPPDARAFSTARLAELEPQVARLEIAVAPADASLLVDGRPVHVRRARDLPVMPGAHEITATRVGYRAGATKVTVALGERQRVALTLAAAPLMPPPPGVLADDSATRRTRRRLRDAGLGVGSFGVASVVVGAGLAALTASLEQRINHPKDGTPYDPSLVGRAQTSQSLEIACFTIGGAAVATAAVLLVAATGKLQHHARLAPAGRSAAGLGFAF
jgi:hypothetical protein